MLPFHRLTIINFGFRCRGRLAGLHCVISFSVSVLVLQESLPLLRATAGTRPSPCVGKHSSRVFHLCTHTRSLSAVSATERHLAFACCDIVVIVCWRQTARRINRFEPSRSSGSRESPLTNVSEFLGRLFGLRACSRTSSGLWELAAGSHLPGVSGVA